MKSIVAFAIVIALACAAFVALAAEPRAESDRVGRELRSGAEQWSGPLWYSRDSGPALRVCSDPNNLPFSNARGEGFENRIAELLARDLGTHVAYTWWAQRRGFLRNTLNAGACDVVIGYPADAEMAQTTAPYYRSSYMFVTRRGLRIDSLDDPRLQTLRVGVQLIGDDGGEFAAGACLEPARRDSERRRLYGLRRLPRRQSAVRDRRGGRARRH